MTTRHPNGQGCWTARSTTSLAGAFGLVAVVAFLTVAGLVAWVFLVKDFLVRGPKTGDAAPEQPA
jgi:hypothetical protein